MLTQLITSASPTAARRLLRGPVFRCKLLRQVPPTPSTTHLLHALHVCFADGGQPGGRQLLDHLAIKLGMALQGCRAGAIDGTVGMGQHQLLDHTSVELGVSL